MIIIQHYRFIFRWIFLRIVMLYIVEVFFNVWKAQRSNNERLYRKLLNVLRELLCLLHSSHNRYSLFFCVHFNMCICQGEKQRTPPQKYTRGKVKESFYWSKKERVKTFLLCKSNSSRRTSSCGWWIGWMSVFSSFSP